MKKISLFLLTTFIVSSVFIFPTFAEETRATGKIPTADELTCIQDAITTRDTALVAAYDTFSATVKNALTTRTGALKTAWAKSTMPEIQTALKDVWRAYRKSVTDARIALRKAKMAAWETFHTEKMTCFPDNKAGVDSATMQNDAQL
jgi:hypothetical protein